MITKVQLPMAREALVLATNQGLLYVLSMVVIGGMVGGRQPRLHRGLRLQPGPAVRQGSRRGHRHRRARDHARPDRAVRRRAVRQVTRRLSAVRRGARKGRSMARGLRRHAAIALATFVGLGLAACGGGDIESNDTAAGDCGELNIAVNPWTGYVANAHVIGKVAEKELGCKVDYPEVKEEVGWQGMADGSIDTIVENWGHPDLIKKYIDEQGTVVDAGLTGNDGIIGWYVPQWMAEEYPDITELGEPQQVRRHVRDLGVRRQGPAARRRPVVRHQRRGAGEEPRPRLQGGRRRQRGGAASRASGPREENKTPLLAYFYSRSGSSTRWTCSGSSCRPTRRAATPTRRRSTATTRRTTQQADLDGVRRLRLAGGRPDQELRPGPTRTRTWSRPTSPRTA